MILFFKARTNMHLICSSRTATKSSTMLKRRMSQRSTPEVGYLYLCSRNQDSPQILKLDAVTVIFFRCSIMSFISPETVDNALGFPQINAWYWSFSVLFPYKRMICLLYNLDWAVCTPADISSTSSLVKMKQVQKTCRFHGDVETFKHMTDKLTRVDFNHVVLERKGVGKVLVSLLALHH